MESSRGISLPANFVSLQMLQRMRLGEAELKNKEQEEKEKRSKEEEDAERRLKEEAEENTKRGSTDDDLKKSQTEKSAQGVENGAIKRKLSEKKKRRKIKWANRSEKLPQSKNPSSSSSVEIRGRPDGEMVATIGSLNRINGGRGAGTRGNNPNPNPNPNPNLVWMKKGEYGGANHV